ncbi:uncharacterized protein [Ambystoma mexicanum]|uniref:uncharacterized protein n=1 Tax=Ambystoma mexicanum TaxID=8296 RepID=UPI0037E84B32
MAPLTFPPAEVPQQTGVDLQLPVPAIVLIAVGAYLLAMVLIILIRQCLLAQGLCIDCCSWDKTSHLGLCDCCFTCAEFCDCRIPSVASCLDTCCPRSNGCDCESCAGYHFCPLCDCACAYQPPDCQSINCICFEIKLR